MKPGFLGRRCAARPDAHRSPTRHAPPGRIRGRRNLRDRIHGTDHADERRWPGLAQARPAPGPGLPARHRRRLAHAQGRPGDRDLRPPARRLRGGPRRRRARGPGPRGPRRRGRPGGRVLSGRRPGRRAPGPPPLAPRRRRHLRSGRRRPGRAAPGRGPRGPDRAGPPGDRLGPGSVRGVRDPRRGRGPPAVRAPFPRPPPRRRRRRPAGSGPSLRRRPGRGRRRRGPPRRPGGP